MPIEKIDQLSEHEAAPIAPLMADMATDEQKQDLKMVMEYMEQGKTARAPYDTTWTEKSEFYKGKQWKNGGKKYKSKPVVNIIRVAVQSIIPLLTDARPGFNINPQEPQDYEFSETVSTLTESWWDKSGMDETIIEVLMDSQIVDAGFLKVTFDNDLMDGIGDIRVDVISPEDIYIPKGARDFDKNCPWVIHKTDKTVGELKRKFPQFADKIKSDGADQTSQDKKSKDADAETILVSPIDVKATDDTRPNPSGTDDRNTATVYECWMDDETVEEYNAEHKEDGDSTERQFKKKYPNGKVVICLPFQKLVLYSGENPYKHGKKPFVRFVDAIIPREFYGEGEAGPLIDIQKCINKTLANILDYMNMMGNPIWINERNNGVDPERLTNQTGLVISVNTGMINSVKRDIPPPLPNYIMEIYNLFMKATEIVSGTTDVTQGRRPLGITAAEAIESLQEAAHTRIRLKERNMQRSLSQLGLQVVALMLQYYREPRIYRIEGKDKRWPAYVDFFIEDAPNGGYILNKKMSKFNETENRYQADDTYTQQKASKGMFDIKILSGTSMPFAKTQRSNLAMRLFEKNAIDDVELLKTLEWPDYEQVLKRLAEKANAMAQAQPQAQQQPQIKGGM